jgi:hypothetical protein
MCSWATGHVVVLWGGLGSGGTAVRDVAWQRDGANWSQIASPGARSDAAAIDVGSGILFFGGGNLAGYQKRLLDLGWDSLAPIMKRRRASCLATVAVLVFAATLQAAYPVRTDVHGNGDNFEGTPNGSVGGSAGSESGLEVSGQSPRADSPAARS